MTFDEFKEQYEALVKVGDDLGYIYYTHDSGLELEDPAIRKTELRAATARRERKIAEFQSSIRAAGFIPPISPLPTKEVHS